MDSDNELFHTQKDPEYLLNKIAEGTLETSEMQPDRAKNAPYGIELSDISDNELLEATQEAEKQDARRFGQPVTEDEVLAKSIKRQVYYYLIFAISLIIW